MTKTATVEQIRAWLAAGPVVAGTDIRGGCKVRVSAARLCAMARRGEVRLTREIGTGAVIATRVAWPETPDAS